MFQVAHDRLVVRSVFQMYYIYGSSLKANPVYSGQSQNDSALSLTSS